MDEHFESNPFKPVSSVFLYDDRLIVDEATHLPFTGDVIATVDEVGGIRAVRGRNLADKGIGTLALDPLGPFVAGNAKVEEVDTRKTFLLVQCGSWSYSREVDPDRRNEILMFANDIRSAASKFASAPVEKALAPGPVPRDAPQGLAHELRELGELHKAGVLSSDEFAAAKRTLLGDNLN